jgi:hypothetical protein
MVAAMTMIAASPTMLNVSRRWRRAFSSRPSALVSATCRRQS